MHSPSAIDAPAARAPRGICAASITTTTATGTGTTGGAGCGSETD
jgi:hypothetical protein